MSTATETTVADVPMAETGPMSFMNKLKSVRPLRSEKPFLITSRDALIVAVITVLVMLVFMFFVHLVAGTTEKMLTMDFALTMGKSFGTALAFQYAYEYAGFNSMLAESAMRYAKGSALSKYKSRNEAFVANMAAQEALKYMNDTECKDKISEININLKRFEAMIKATRQTPLITQMRQDKPEISEEEILALINKRKEYVTAEELNLLLHLDPNDNDAGNLERLRATSRLVEIMGTHEEVVRYFMREGFSKLKPTEGKFGNATLDLPGLLSDLGMHIQAEKELSMGKKFMLQAGRLVPILKK